MNSNTILNWDNTDHKEIYIRQLNNNPLYWNEDLNCWVTYSYNFCKAILLNNDAQIPGLALENDSLLNDKAKLLIKKLTRLSNNEQHHDARQAALLIYQNMKPLSVSKLLENLLSKVNTNEFDWVATVCKQLPVLVILKGLGFDDDDCAFVTDNISSLVKIMSPNKTESVAIAINRVVNEFYAISEKYIHSVNKDEEEVTELFVCNLIGLFIQCYDAGRGILTNTLLNLVHYHNQKPHLADIKKMVIETLRFDPPVHSTRRIAVKDILINGQHIKTGQSILIVMAAANLDQSIFKDPELHNPARNNNDQHLTFGIGAHNCLAKHLTIDMAAETCSFLSEKYGRISIPHQELKYEPQLNVRLIKELMLNLS
ncbi:MAG: Cytochrome [Mucilaginibacter sp.]|nr:Cytochrome [Mucilaginibacter sp.]